MRSNNETKVAPHMMECYQQDKNFTGVCPSEGFYFTIVCLGEYDNEGGKESSK